MTLTHETARTSYASCQPTGKDGSVRAQASVGCDAVTT
jgi:hypothetical protein